MSEHTIAAVRCHLIGFMYENRRLGGSERERRAVTQGRVNGAGELGPHDPQSSLNLPYLIGRLVSCAAMYWSIARTVSFGCLPFLLSQYV